MRLKRYSQKLGDYWQVFKHSMISILPKKTWYMTETTCIKTVLYKQEATIFHLILNKPSKSQF